MSFFEPPPPAPEPEHFRQPAWIGPPDNEIGISVPLSALLARTDEIAIALLGVTAFSTGFQLEGTVRTRRQLDTLHEAFVMHHRNRHGTELDPELFRFGIEFCDGRKATNLAHPFQREQQDEDPAQPVLIARGGGGGGRNWEMNWWVWPLPPPGPLALVCEWPAQGIELTRYELNATTVLEAASGVEALWPDDDGPSAAGNSVQIVTSRRAPPRPEATGPGTT